MAPFKAAAFVQSTELNGPFKQALPSIGNPCFCRNSAKFDEPQFRSVTRTTSVGMSTLGSAQALAKASSAQLELPTFSFQPRSIPIGQEMKLSGAVPLAR